ncbi:aminopeptidase [Stutzerimonas xanthomarina]|uniref:Predicted aminopeptidase n=2 Tax=Stutzerimonas xanthomarina TaxID=271420 RepID=A0A1M5TG32_9GAMM|nr:aminopeptidase [Stutzerimonas xanthomarina]MCP9340829.1 aminopeptidase [Stutzerimonas xanthomarina]SEH54412.1 Predicted aminopeptidase [Stutzerimonas xanthomarina]SHH49601.1 Predicted aminopeptidase [Stutzerimonas xanthomarina DSM 18231]
MQAGKRLFSSKPKIAAVDKRMQRWVPLLLAAGLSGCSSYYGQLAVGQLELLRQREPIAAILDNSQSDPQLRQRLALALQARAFASHALGLPDNRSYRVYADIQRPYVVWNVFATEEFSVAPLSHCFPIAGCVAYRGYYREGRARGAAALLKAEGHDTLVAGVPAYSTLGWFDDPLLSSMLRWDDERLAGLIFHELAHQQFYLADDTAFNESFASFVEREGLRQWRASRSLPPPNETARKPYADLSKLVLATRDRLAAIYASDLSESAMRAAKRDAFMHMRQAYRQLRDGPWKGDDRFDRWMSQPLNNASLVPFGLYDKWVPAFAALFDRAGGDWQRFYAETTALGRLPADERKRQLDALR